jgi:elongation factor Ts
MDCKNALNEANGNFEEAMAIIRKKGQAVAAKRSDRDAAEGCVLADVKDGYAAVLALKCETDFVAKNADFIALTKDILNCAIESKAADLDALNNSKIGDSTVAQLVTDRSGITGEKMELDMYEHIEGASVISYIHPGNKLATIVAFNEAGVDTQVMKDVAMQVAAMNPAYLDPASVPQEVIEKEKAIMIAQMKEDPKMAGKPEQVLAKIVEGKMGKYFKENTLVEQTFIMDDIAVGKYIANVAKELGGEIKVVDFVRFEKGEGIEKRVDDFASEVAGMVK